MAGQLHTPAEAAGILRVRESWLKTKAAARVIPCTFIGKHLRFSDDDIAAIMQAGARQPVVSRDAQAPPRVRLTSEAATGRAHGVCGEAREGPAPWRVKYKLPSGIETSESGFETKAAALTWGRDQEARIREGRWTDPNAGKLTVGEWIDRWLAIQDVGISTVDHRDYLLRRFIRPAWDETPLHSLSTEEITRWENALPARTGVSPRTARAARTLLGTILGDAATTRPPLIPYNPALRPRNRGRRTGRRLQLSPQRAWATPLETLLLAERAALLTGRDEDFTMILTIGYTGLRWGEAIGLEHGYLHARRDPRRMAAPRTQRPVPPAPAQGRLLPQPGLGAVSPCRLAAFPHRFAQPPDPGPRASRPAAAPPSTAAAADTSSSAPTAATTGAATTPAACSAPPATDATKPKRAGRQDSSSPTPPPGPASPSPPGHPQTHRSRDYAPPRGRGIQVIRDDTPLACWLPIKPGLTVHGLRHSHKTWMAEDGIPEILAEQRLGHQVPGMRGLYAHASDRMRDDLRHALQTRWEDSLRARATIAPRSPVPLLDELLTAEVTPPEPGDTGRQGEDDLPNSSQPPQAARASHPRDPGRTGINRV